MRHLSIFMLGAVSVATLGAQTLVDLRSQAKGVDFTQAASTKPIKSGTVLPATCAVNELFLDPSASPGGNIFVCLTADTWIAQGGGSGSGVPLTFRNNGALVGQGGTANFVTGAGLVDTLTDTGVQINIQHAVDTAVVETKLGLQGGTTLACISLTASSTTYTCAMSPTLTQYTTNMVLRWKPDLTATGDGTTLNIDTLGARSVLLADGVSNPTAADVVSGRLYDLWYDGTSFRIQAPSMTIGSAAVRPACAVELRGRLWQTFGTTGVKDEAAVCAKDASNTYAWRVLY